MTADAMALADDKDTVSVLFEADQALVRAGDQMACVDLPNLADIVDAVFGATANADEPPVLRLINGTQSDLAGSSTSRVEGGRR